MTLEDFLSRLDGVRRSSRGYQARCPAHEDGSPSLSIAEGDLGLLLHCFAECEKPAIVRAMGLTMADLFFDAPISRRQRPTPKPQKIDCIAVAFRFELAALDRHLRAERVLKAATNFNIDALTDEQLDRLMNAVAPAYSDGERAELLETVADDLRLKAFLERTGYHAA